PWLGSRLSQANRIPMRNSPRQPPLSLCDKADRGGEGSSSCSYLEEEAMPRDSWPQDLCGGSWSSNAEGWLGSRLSQANRIPMRNSPRQPPLSLCDKADRGGEGSSSCSYLEEEAMPRDSWPQDLCGGSWSSNAEGWLGSRLSQANRIPMRNSLPCLCVTRRTEFLMQ